MGHYMIQSDQCLQSSAVVRLDRELERGQLVSATIYIGESWEVVSLRLDLR